MFRFTHEQLDAMAIVDEDAFIETMRAFVRENDLPGSELPDSWLSAMIRNGMARARSHGFSTARGVAYFVTIMFEFAPNFDEDPNVEPYLSSRDLSDEQRADLLEAQTTDDDWKRIVLNYDEDCWFPE